MLERCLPDAKPPLDGGRMMWPPGEDAAETEGPPTPTATPDVLDKVKFEQLRMQIGQQNSANLLRLFAVDAPKYFMREGDEPCFGKRLAEEAHSFGGSAGLLGFDELMEACRDLEIAVDWGEGLEETYLPRARRARERALEEIDRLLADDGLTGPVRSTA